MSANQYRSELERKRKQRVEAEKKAARACLRIDARVS